MENALKKKIPIKMSMRDTSAIYYAHDSYAGKTRCISIDCGVRASHMSS